MILISACLLGYNCKYTGGNNLRPKIVQMSKEIEMLPVCPEILGGLPVPREPVQFDKADGYSVMENKARLFNLSGEDVTEFFLQGARESLKKVKEYGIKKAVLKERSPSCGTSFVYIRDKGDEPVAGKGVTAALLEKEGLLLYSDEMFF